MRILLISPLPLFPNSNGATERILNIIHLFAYKGNEVTIALPYTYQGTEADYGELKRHGKIKVFKLFSSEIPSSSGEEASKGFLKQVRDLIPFNLTIFSPSRLAKLYAESKTNRPDVIIGEFDGSWLVAYILTLLLGSHLIIDKHNVESILYYRLTKRVKPKLTLIEKLCVNIVLLIERIVWAKSDGTVVVSARDYSISRQLFGDKKNLVIASNGVENPALKLIPNKVETRKWLDIPFESKIMIFHGLGTYGPNIEARERLLQIILPLTREESQNDVYAVIVGPGNTPISQVRSYNKIRLVGEVSKEKLFQIICSSDVAVVPLKSGSGTRLKILDYFNAKVPVVATALAAEGLPIEDGRDILIRNDDAGIVQAIINVLSDNQLSSRLTQNAKSLLENKLRWETTLKPIEELAWQLSFGVDEKKSKSK